MTYWKLISTGDPVQTDDPVGSDRITTSPARAGTGERRIRVIRNRILIRGPFGRAKY